MNFKESYQRYNDDIEGLRKIKCYITKEAYDLLEYSITFNFKISIIRYADEITLETEQALYKEHHLLTPENDITTIKLSEEEAKQEQTGSECM